MDEYTMQETDGQPGDVSGFTTAPLRATVSMLSEGRRYCLRCGSRIDGLAGYLDDAEGRWVGVVHEECVLPKELDADPEHENKTTPATPRLQKVEREIAQFYGTQFFSPRNGCA